jgi:hypothetical protein
LPYGAQVARTRTKSQQRKLRYAPVRESDRDIPPWIDDVLERAVHPDPSKRYEALSEYLYDLRHPKENRRNSSIKPLLERNPLLFWKVLSLVLACVIVILLAKLRGAF